MIKQEITVLDAVTVLRQALASDPEYYQVYQANIAMAFFDAMTWERKQAKRGYISRRNVRNAAQVGASHFLDLLIGDIPKTGGE